MRGNGIITLSGKGVPAVMLPGICALLDFFERVSH